MDKSRAEGYDVSRQILRSLGRVARLHKKAPEHASLAVLKAPDIPSVLVETGFISNHAEEQLLATASYQDQLARAIFEDPQLLPGPSDQGAMLTGKGQASNKQAAVSRPAPRQQAGRRQQAGGATGAAGGDQPDAGHRAESQQRWRGTGQQRRRIRPAPG